MMKFIIFVCSILVYFYSLTCAAATVILHTNDMHCGLDHGVQLSGVVWLKKHHLSKGDKVILVDAGDAIQGDLLGTLTKGQAIVRMMNKAGYDFAVPGNHEFDFGMEQFFYLNSILDCHYCCANLFDKNSCALDKHKIFNIDGEKIGFIALTTPTAITSSTPAHFVDRNNGQLRYSFGEINKPDIFYRNIQSVIDEVKKQGTNKIVLVAHFGNHVQNWSVRELVRNIQDVDVVIDGHSHELYTEYMQDKTGKIIPVTQTGHNLQTVGRIIFDGDSVIVDKVDSVQALDETVAGFLAYEKSVFLQSLDRPVGHTGFSLYTHDRYGKNRLIRCKETNLGDFVADAFRYILRTNIGVVNGGCIRQSIEEGAITYGDILGVCPFLNSLCIVKMTGEEIRDMLEFSVHMYPKEFGGFLQVSGIEFSFASWVPSPVQKDNNGFFTGFTDGERRVRSIKINGKPLKLSKVYTVAGTDYILRSMGNGYTMFKNAKLQRLSLLNGADAVVEYIRDRMGGKIDDRYSFYLGQQRILFTD